MLKNLSGYKGLIKNIGNILSHGRQRAYVAVDNILVETYWHVGREIVEYEQQGNERAEYGSELLLILSKDLKIQHGKGFSISNVYAMRQFYLKYQKFQTVSGKLTWSHYVVLLWVSDDLAREFYAKQCVNETWSVRNLERQVNSMLFERIALSKDKKGVLKMSKEGQIITKGEDAVKEPYVLEFLGIPQGRKYSEKDDPEGNILGRTMAYYKYRYWTHQTSPPVISYFSDLKNLYGDNIERHLPILIYAFEENVGDDQSFGKLMQEVQDFKDAHLSTYEVDTRLLEVGSGTSAAMTGGRGILQTKADEAMKANTGGIDLNSANLAMTIKRDGNGVPLPLSQQDLAQLNNIEGLDPVILSIKPASQTALFAELVAHH